MQSRAMLFNAFPSDRHDCPRSRADVVRELRRLLPRLDRVTAETRALSFGLPALDSYLPQGGLAFGALHEVAPDAEGDAPAAFGFVTAACRRGWSASWSRGEGAIGRSATGSTLSASTRRA
jgi:hypothetical protein